MNLIRRRYFIGSTFSRTIKGRAGQVQVKNKLPVREGSIDIYDPHEIGYKIFKCSGSSFWYRLTRMWDITLSLRYCHVKNFALSIYNVQLTISRHKLHLKFINWLLQHYFVKEAYNLRIWISEWAESNDKKIWLYKNYLKLAVRDFT